MRYTINLATRTYLDHRLLNRIGCAILALLVVIMGWNVIDVSSNMGELSRLDSEIIALESKIALKPGDVSEADFNRQKNRIRLYNEILDRKSVNWLNTLDHFESVTPEGIALSSLTPDKKNEAWRIDGRALSFNTLQHYVEKLEASKNFSHVLLLSHQSIAVGEKRLGVQFTISCKVAD